MAVVALPQFLHRGDDFAQALTGLPGVHARHQPFIFIAVSAARHTKIQPAVHDQVGHRCFAGQFDRMPERRDDCAGAETHIFGAPGQVDQADERVGRDGEIHAVMFTGPDRMHAALIGDLAQFQKFLIEFLLAVVSRDTFEVEKKREFHRISSRIEWGALRHVAGRRNRRRNCQTGFRWRSVPA